MVKQLLRVGLAAGFVSTMVATSTPAEAALRGRIMVDGSSTVFPITEAVAEEFSGVEPRVRVTVGISGTGGGFKRFAVGETDISDASRPIKAKELALAIENNVNFIEIPVAYDGLSIVVNKENTWATSLTVEQLNAIFADGSTVDTWDDINPEWPNVKLEIFSPGPDSGTFDYFKEVVLGKNGSMRSDVSVSEDDNTLVRGVFGRQGAIGFFGCAYYFENTDKLRAVPVVNPNGQAVLPSAEAIESGDYAPFSRPLFIYVSTKSAEREEVRAFVDFYIENAGTLAGEVGYVSLPSSVYAAARRAFENGTTGTRYLTESGEKVKKSVTELYR
ncbi:MAG: PstS family phosphate ABC transporter substrate-binding protein [Phycisphaerales bacterium JB043]